MAKQDVTVELFYDSVWNDHTSSIYGRDAIQITRGRSDEQGGPTPASCTLTFDNRTGTFNPRNPASTLYGLIGRNTPLRVTVGTSVRFVGEVSSWKPRRAIKGDAWTDVTASGLLRRTGQGASPLRSAHWREVQLNGPIAFWPLTDGVDATTAASALQAGEPMPILKDGALELRQINRWNEAILTPKTGEFVTYNGPVGQAAADTEWSADLAFAVDTDAEDADLGFTLMGPPSGLAGLSLVQWTLSLDAIGTDDFVTWEIIVRQSDGVTASQTTIATGTVAVKDGRLHHVRLTTDNNGANTDWELLFDNSSVDSGTTAEPWLPVQSVRLDYGTETAGQMTAGFAVVWDTASPPANVANAAVVGRSGELAGDRLARVCAEQDVAFTLSGTAADTEAMGPQPIDTFNAIVAECERTDGGRLFETRGSAGLTYRTRVDIYNQDPGLELDFEGGEIAPTLDPDIDDLNVRNDITVQRPDGSSARAVQETGPLNVQAPEDDPDGVGRYEVQVDVNTDSDGVLANHAAWHLHLGTVPDTRYPLVTVDLDAAPGLVADADAVEVGDVIAIDNLPDSDGQARLLVGGYTETIGTHRRLIAFNCEPASPYDIGVYDDAGSRYDSSHSTTAAQITTGTSTSLSVAVEAGRSLWTTSGAAVPFDINLAGARVRVTAVSGASSPQTFTISATVVNGINKVIASGTPVRLWSPKRYGL
jgi:hypothetical protein